MKIRITANNHQLWLKKYYFQTSKGAAAAIKEANSEYNLPEDVEEENDEKHEDVEVEVEDEPEDRNMRTRKGKLRSESSQ